MTTYTGISGVFAGLPPVVDEATPSHELGEKMYTADGRAFRYAKAGAVALVSGSLLQGPAEATGNQSRIVAAAAVGATSVTTTDTVTVTANQYAGGFVVVTGEAGTGTGWQYRIKSHPAATAAVCTFTLEDPIQVALTAATQVDLVANLYNGVIINPTTASGAVVGVAINEVTAGQYGWIQVEGLCTVYQEGTTTVGGLVVASNGSAGAVEKAANGSTELQAPVGYAATGCATAEYGAVKLFIG